MLLSIVVPVYNVEKYLIRCIDSLLDQGEFKDYEIILVDDGSNDKSGEICDDYSNNFKNIKVLHKANGGLSSARNAGIRISDGEYVMFVDSDDYIRSCVLTGLVQNIIADNIDILVYNFSHIFGEYNAVENAVFLKDYSKVVSGAQYLLDNLKSGTMHMMACNKIYRKNLIIENDIYFREGYLHEDEEWSPRIFYIADSVKQIDKTVYGYCIRSDSISSIMNKRKAAIDLVDNCKELLMFTSEISDMELKSQLENNIITLCLSAYYKGRLSDRVDEIKKIIDQVEIKNDKNKKKSILFGFNPQIYILVNHFNKLGSHFKAFLLKTLSKFKALNDCILNKIRKECRYVFISKNQRKKLKNHSFSIISSSCNGGVIISELGEQFRTPTVNLWFEAKDYIKMITNLKHYMSLEPKEVKNNFCNYPVGRIDDITVYFMHYHTFEEAVEKWDERKKRINYDNLFFMMAEKDGCTKEMVLEFDELPFNNKVIFTCNEYTECRSAIFVKEGSTNGEVAIMTDFVGFIERRYDDHFDYVGWLNEGSNA